MGKAEDYFVLANNDAKIASLIINSANDELMLNSAAYHVEQAVEKAIKGLIVEAGGKAGISHNIIELCKDMEELGISYPEWLEEWDDDITSWATTIRYNVNFKAEHDDVETVLKNTQDWLGSMEGRKNEQ